jgi:hypothetical protein
LVPEAVVTTDDKPSLGVGSAARMALSASMLWGCGCAMAAEITADTPNVVMGYSAVAVGAISAVVLARELYGYIKTQL